MFEKLRDLLKGKLTAFYGKLRELSRRPIPVATFLLFSIFAYNLFLKKRFVIPKMTEDIVTLDLKYLAKNFDLFAKRGVEQAGRKFLYGIDLSNEKGKIKAGYADIKNEDNALFKDGVEGENDVWTFKADEAQYSKKKDDTIFSLIGHVDTYNKEKQIRIKAENFRLNNELKRLKLKGSIVVESGDTKLKGELADFEEDTNILNISDSVEIELNLSGEAMKIETTALSYNSESKEGESDKPFKILYKDLIIHGKGFKIKGEDFTTEREIKIEDKNQKTELYSTNVAYLNKQLSLKDIRGKYDGANISSEELNNEGNKTSLKGSVRVSKEDKRIECDLLVIDDESMQAEGDVKILKGSDSISTQSATYGRKDHVLVTSAAEIVSGERKILCASLKYSEDSESGLMQNMRLASKDLEIAANKVNFDMKRDDYDLEERVEIVSEDVRMRSEKISAVAGLFRIPKLSIQKGETEIRMKNCSYDKKTELFLTEEEILGRNGNYLFKTDGLRYSRAGGNGELKGSIQVENKEEEFSLFSEHGEIENNVLLMRGPSGKRKDVKFSAEKGKYSEDDLFTLSERVVVKGEKLRVLSPELSYDLKNNILFFDVETDINSEDILITAAKGKVFVNDETIYSENATIIRENGDIFKADLVEAIKAMEVIQAKGNVYGDLARGAKFKSDYGRIFFLSKEDNKFTRAELNSNVEFRFKELLITSNFLEYDNTVGERELELVFARDNLKITIKLPEGGADMKAKYAFYELNKEIGRMKRDVHISYRSDRHGIINASADEAIHDNKLNIVGMMKNVKAKGSKSGLNVTGDNVELDMNTGIIKSTGKAGFNYNISKTGAGEDEIKSEIVSEFEEEIEAVENIVEQFNS